ncbi:ribosomal protein L4/L1e [Desulfurobacterium thermolithotrophum DSM 11699]|uniref:Large ribosomal subunit protein uL4 n=1 Tax=Desulfurobacterium thermolithotrophum (strain DSM 11699 / BSA) TaxID=868864 RepID=F0S1C1_DESTD|nr:50S ribosomal protein L4 [Desulfurobacterium thermolithotrophum]ADY72852.1 ribosomal protein L4/L1e [Desulfurobacterium thermolithotrophum DSM 11699]
MEIKVVNAANQEVGTVTIKDEIANAPIKKHAVWETVKWQLAKRRRGTHSTKTRGEVRGGGKKPWPQKHTGRARQGSIRAPQWVGGGVVHGPKPRDYYYPLPKKVRKVALRSVVAGRLQEGNLIVVEDFTFEKPKTKQAIEFLRNLGLENEKVLIVVPELEENTYKSFRNLPNVKLLEIEGLNVYDMLCYDKCIFFKSTLPKLEERLSL